jgi:hypothetical protein
MEENKKLLRRELKELIDKYGDVKSEERVKSKGEYEPELTAYQQMSVWSLMLTFFGFNYYIPYFIWGGLIASLVFLAHEGRREKSFILNFQNLIFFIFPLFCLLIVLNRKYAEFISTL